MNTIDGENWRQNTITPQNPEWQNPEYRNPEFLNSELQYIRDSGIRDSGGTDRNPEYQIMFHCIETRPV